MLLLLRSRELLVLGLGGYQLPGSLELGDFLGEEKLFVEVWVKEPRAVAVFQEGDQKSPVVVIGDPPAIVDEARHEDHRVERDLFGFENEIPQHFDARVDIRVVELVGDVPAQGAKLPALLNDRMEEAEANQEGLPSVGEIEEPAELLLQGWPVAGHAFVHQLLHRNLGLVHRGSWV